MKSFAFKRPFCTPESGIVPANSVVEAFRLIERAYGYADDARIYSPETNEEYVMDQGKIKKWDATQTLCI